MNYILSSVKVLEIHLRSNYTKTKLSNKDTRVRPNNLCTAELVSDRKD